MSAPIALGEPFVRDAPAALPGPSLGKRIERGFEAWAHWICRNRSLAILLPILMTVFFVSWLPGLEIDNSSESFLTKDDPAWIRFDAFREQFGRDDVLLIVIRPPELFDLAFLDKLRRFHEASSRTFPTSRRSRASSTRAGLISMIPNVLPVILTLGAMGWLDMPLDVSTIMIGAIVIGVAVDDTIHFMHKFQRYYEDTGDAYEAIRSTLETTGAALLFTTLVLTGGFGIISVGTLVNIQNFGMLAAFATAAAFLADLFVSPALMALATAADRQATDSARPSATRPAGAAPTGR